MIEKLKALFTQRRRAYYYRVAGGVGAVALVYGLVDSNELFAWLGLAAVVFNTPPAANTSTKKD